MQTPDSEIRNQSPSDYMEKKELAELVDSAINDYCSPLERIIRISRKNKCAKS